MAAPGVATVLALAFLDPSVGYTVAGPLACPISMPERDPVVLAYDAEAEGREVFNALAEAGQVVCWHFAVLVDQDPSRVHYSREFVDVSTLG
jgi:hypothetical protein